MFNWSWCQHFNKRVTNSVTLVFQDETAVSLLFGLRLPIIVLLNLISTFAFATTSNGDYATIPITVNSASLLMSAGAPYHSLGVLGPQSTFKLTLTSDFTRSFSGQSRISSADLLNYLKSHSSAGFVPVQVTQVVLPSTVRNVSIGSVALSDLLQRNAVTLDQISYAPPTASQRQAAAQPMAATSDCHRCLSPSANGPTELRAQVGGLAAITRNPMAPIHSVPYASGSDTNYQNRPDVQRLMQSALARTTVNYNKRTKQYFGRKNPFRWTGSCWHYIKSALYDSGMVTPGFLEGSVPASDAKRLLLAAHFDNLIDKDPDLKYHPERAPIGSILVYRGSGKGWSNGDIQVKTPNWYVADYLSKNAMTNQHNGRHFELIGVMVKP